MSAFADARRRSSGSSLAARSVTINASTRTSKLVEERAERSATASVTPMNAAAVGTIDDVIALVHFERTVTKQCRERAE